jgi:Predicted nucleotide-binding protein containing TIR-like domain
MTPRRQPKSTGSEAEPVLRVTRSQLDEEIVQRLELGQQLLERPVQDAGQVELLHGEFATWDEVNQRLLRSRFSTARVADEYMRVTFGYASVRNWPVRLQEIHKDILGQMRKLGSICQQLDLFGSEVEGDEVIGSLAESPPGTKIFVVHGHDGEIKYQVVEFIQRITGARPVILHEQADSSRTIIEKFEDHASEIGFAVVLLTADDVGRAKGVETLSPRARQNVVFEFGFFIAKLGRSRVVALYEKGVELPSDLSGVLYKQLAGNWHTELARELRAAGIEVDLRNLV